VSFSSAHLIICALTISFFIHDSTCTRTKVFKTRGRSTFHVNIAWPWNYKNDNFATQLNWNLKQNVKLAKKISGLATLGVWVHATGPIKIIISVTVRLNWIKICSRYNVTIAKILIGSVGSSKNYLSWIKESRSRILLNGETNSSVFLEYYWCTHEIFIIICKSREVPHGLFTHSWCCSLYKSQRNWLYVQD